MQQKIILGIPGTWKDRSEFVQTFAKNNLNEYLFAGMMIQKMDTLEHFQVDIYDADPNLTEAFEYAFEYNFDSPITDNDLKATLNQIENHTMTIYLIGEGGSFEKANKVVQAAKAILKAGGLAVKIETTGKAYTGSQWSNISSNPTELELSIILSTFVQEEGKFLFSCGLQNVGEKDVIIADSQLDVNSAFQLGAVFSSYIIDEKPTIQKGHTFSLDEKTQHYIVKHTDKYVYNQNDELFYNPNGYWVLEPLQVVADKPKEEKKGWFGKLFG